MKERPLRLWTFYMKPTTHEDGSYQEQTVTVIARTKAKAVKMFHARTSPSATYQWMEASARPFS